MGSTIDTVRFQRLIRSTLLSVSTAKFAAGIANASGGSLELIFQQMLDDALPNGQVEALAAVAEGAPSEATRELALSALQTVVLVAVFTVLVPFVVAAATTGVIDAAEATLFVCNVVGTICAHNPTVSGAVILYPYVKPHRIITRKREGKQGSD